MGAMPGDPKECREYARNCQRLAATAPTDEVRESFASMAQTWLRLANELEATHALLKAYARPELDVSIPAIEPSQRRDLS